MANRITSPRKALVSIVLSIALVGQPLMTANLLAQVQTINCPAPGFGEVVIPPVPGIPVFIPLTSLKTVPNPVFPPDEITLEPALRADLVDYIANVPAAIQLGKALFWEMQAGSDNKTACATCHFQAGADVRTKNQLNPGANGNFNLAGPNALLTPLPISPTYDDIAGSQGVRKSTFQGFSKSGAELTTSVSDSVFKDGGKNVRQVTGKNTPSVINAVFNHRNFWNGRAQPDFNGVNPFGSRDSSAKVWVLDYRGSPVRFVINIKDASPASQAVGPALNDVEMSAAGRTFPDLGKKLLLAKPLGLQQVSPTDSVLGGIAEATKGLKVSYKTLIQQAFQPKWWKTTKKVSIGGKSYSMMEANFSLFWGLSIWLYEATLVSDDTPMDQYVATRVFDLFNFDANGLPILLDHNPALLDQVVTRLAGDGINVTRQQILDGLDLFEKPLPPPGIAGLPAGTGVGCSLCHVSAETTSASGRILKGHGPEPGDVAFNNVGFDLRMERMFLGFRNPPPVPPAIFPPVPPGTDWITYDPDSYAVNVISINGTLESHPVPVGTYDSGWYNIGVRPTADDPGLDGKDPFGKYLSWTRLYQALSDPSFIKVPGGGLGCPYSPPAAPATSPFAGEVLNPITGLPLLSGPLHKAEATDVAGTFKTSSLRNVEYNGPYFHNGGKASLRQAVELYDNGGDFDNPTRAPLIRPLGMTDVQIKSLVAFLLALTDERVRLQKAPFDHPELVVPNGQDANGNDIPMPIPAVGAGGSAIPLQRFLNLNPFDP